MNGQNNSICINIFKKICYFSTQILARNFACYKSKHFDLINYYECNPNCKEGTVLACKGGRRNNLPEISEINLK